MPWSEFIRRKIQERADRQSAQELQDEEMSQRAGSAPSRPSSSYMKPSHKYHARGIKTAARFGQAFQRSVQELPEPEVPQPQDGDTLMGAHTPVSERESSERSERAPSERSAREPSEPAGPESMSDCSKDTDLFEKVDNESQLRGIKRVPTSEQSIDEEEEEDDEHSRKRG